MTQNLIVGFTDPGFPDASLKVSGTAILAERLNLQTMQLELGAYPGSTFNECNLTRANFRWTLLSETHFMRSVLIETNFGHSESPGLCVQDCVLHKVCYDECDLRGSTFAGGEAHDCSFRKADLRNAALRFNAWSRLDVRGACYNKHTVWPAGFDPVKEGAILSD